MSALKPIATDADSTVVKQYALSLLYTEHPQADALVKVALDATPKNTVIPAIVKGYKDAVATAKADKIKPAHLDRRYALSFSRGKDMFSQTCSACHGIDGTGTPAPEGEGLTLAPPLKGSKRLLSDKSVPINLVLHGLTGPHENGKLYPNEMAGFPWADDKLVADLLTYARNDFGNKAAAVEPKDVAATRKATAERKTPYTFTEVTEIVAKLAAPPEPKTDDKKTTEKPKAPEGNSKPAPSN